MLSCVPLIFLQVLQSIKGCQAELALLRDRPRSSLHCLLPLLTVILCSAYVMQVLLFIKGCQAELALLRQVSVCMSLLPCLILQC
jgi:hypothetical protein